MIQLHLSTFAGPIGFLANTGTAALDTVAAVFHKLQASLTVLLAICLMRMLEFSVKDVVVLFMSF